MRDLTVTGVQTCALPISIADDAQRAYATWMAAQPVASVAVWAHTGGGNHLSPDQRRVVLAAWRMALPDKEIGRGAGRGRVEVSGVAGFFKKKNKKSGWQR